MGWFRGDPIKEREDIKELVKKFFPKDRKLAEITGAYDEDILKRKIELIKTNPKLMKKQLKIMDSTDTKENIEFFKMDDIINKQVEKEFWGD